MSKTSKCHAIRAPTPEEDKLIMEAARSDPDARPLTAQQMKEMMPARSVLGRPKSENKKPLVSVPTAAKSSSTSNQSERAGNRAGLASSGNLLLATPETHQVPPKRCVHPTLRMPQSGSGWTARVEH